MTTSKRYMIKTEKVGDQSWYWVLSEYDKITSRYWRLKSGFAQTEAEAKQDAFDRTPKIEYTDGNPTNEVSDNND